MKMFGRLMVAAIVAFALLQFVRPAIPTKPTTAEVQAPAAVKQILEKSCYSCHSDQRRLAWFDEIEPVYWLVRHDVLTAREHLDFSTLGSKPAAAQKAALYEAVNMIQLGAMPLQRFLTLHPQARVTPEDLSAIKAYLAPWASLPNQPGAAGPAVGTKTDAAPAAAPTGTPAPVSLAAVRPEPDGFPFDPSFENWKLISTTDRGDNNTFRLIFGNDVALNAAQSGNVSPWPDGARFAKIAWQQEPGEDGLLHPGKFVQVELMLKDSQRYQATDGWGWGRWRGLDLEPYGKNTHFVAECTGCHLPLRGNDYVYTLPITPARISGEEVVNNRAAALPSNLPYQPLGWNAITMYVDPRNRTTAVLFGNEPAMQAVHARATDQDSNLKAPAYGAGAVLSLVTWAQRDDPHWFGARIPDLPQSVEFVQVDASGRIDGYRRFSGNGLTENHPPMDTRMQRTRLILDLTPARLP
jgi:mono/diheme cytochrome c family protein